MMASRAVSAPQTEQPDPPIDGHSGGMPPKPTNSMELGQGPLSTGPNEGPSPELGVLPMPQCMAIEGLPKKASMRRSRPTTEAPRRAWRTR
jgi:hypothetical protein